MSDYYEIDFIKIEASSSGDAITLRYCIDGKETIHVVDGGFKDTGDLIVQHINSYYGNPDKIDRVIVTHSDKDHTGGLASVLNNFEIGELWMLSSVSFFL